MRNWIVDEKVLRLKDALYWECAGLPTEERSAILKSLRKEIDKATALLTA